MPGITQLSVFLENKLGRLAEVTRILAEANINLGALSIADTSDFGILRLICDQPDEATTALRQAGFSVGETEVLAVQVPHRPGGLAKVIATLQPLNINIEYLYAFAGRTGENAVVVMRLEDGRNQEAAQALQQADYVLLTHEEAYVL